MKTDDKHTDLIIEPTETENVTIPEINVNQLPFYKGEDGKYHCRLCKESWDEFSSLRSHVLRKKAKHHGVYLLESPEGVLSIRKKAKESRVSPPRIEKVEPHEEVIEALPDELEHLETLLKEHGIKRRAVVLRSMALRDPASMQELVWALDDVGIAKSRQRRIVSDYSKWLGVKIPDAVIDALSPTPEYESPDRFGRRPYVQEEYEDPRQKTLADLELSEVLEAKRRKIQAEIREIENPRPRYGETDPRLEKALDKIELLEKKLEEERYTALKEEIKELKETSKTGRSQTDAIIEVGHSIERILLGIAGARIEQPPRREKIGGKSDIADLVLETMPEYVE